MRTAADSTRWDLIAIVLAFGLLAVLAEASRGLLGTLDRHAATTLALDPRELPWYAARTTARMFAGLALSLLFTLSYATWAAKSRTAARILIPLLDILQSVPILGFISVTVVFFLNLLPGRVLGAELAAVFAMFTSQAWNMAFSFYQSLRTVPDDLIEAARMLRLSAWERFWRLEVPFAMPGLVWNMMLSMSGAWFFIVAAESISVGSTTLTLPGMGGWIGTAIAARDLPALLWAIVTMLAVILACDQLFFRPLVAWADRFRFELEPGGVPPASWVLTTWQRSRLFRWLRSLPERVYARLPLRRGVAAAGLDVSGLPTGALDRLATAALIVLIAALGANALQSLRGAVGGTDILEVLRLGVYTLLRVLLLIMLAALIWIPVGISIGVRPRLARRVQPIAQFLAAFPANLLFPLLVYLIVRYRLNPDIWLSPLMVLGTQWYILFNVIAGAMAIPTEMLNAGRNLQLRGTLWFRRIALPAVFPYCVTGLLTASGGSWNAAIVAEYADWGSQHLQAAGLGSYIAAATAAGDFQRVLLGICTMSLFVVLINRVLWRPLYRFAERRCRLD